MKKILIVEDDLSIRNLLKYDLEDQGFDVIEVSNGKDALQELEKSKFDMIITDLMMPLMDGKEFVKKIRKMKIDTYCIMLTAIDDEYNKLELFGLGVDDYVTKPFSQRELIARIKRVFKRDEKDKNVLIYKNLRLDLNQYLVYEDEKLVNLTKIDFKLLKFLIKNKGSVITRDQILNTIWGYDYDDTTRVVDVHIHQIRDKFTIEFIKTVRGIGYTII